MFLLFSGQNIQNDPCWSLCNMPAACAHSVHTHKIWSTVMKSGWTMQSALPASGPLPQRLHVRQVPQGSCVCLGCLRYRATTTKRQMHTLLMWCECKIWRMENLMLMLLTELLEQNIEKIFLQSSLLTVVQFWNIRNSKPTDSSCSYFAIMNVHIKHV